MKRIVLLFVVLALSFSCLGCEEKKEATEEKVYSVGETITTEQVEFTIKEYGLYNCLSNYHDETYLTPIEANHEKAYLYYLSNNPFNADDEHIMLQFEYEYKNIGKETIHELKDFKVEYSDGFVFENTNALSQRKDGSFGGRGDIEPLSDKVIARAAVKLPKEVLENEDEPIVVKVKLPLKKGSTINFEEAVIKLR